MIVFVGILLVVVSICGKKPYSPWKDPENERRHKERMRKEREFSKTFSALQKKEDFPLPKDMDVAMECQQIYQHLYGEKQWSESLGFSDEELITYLYRSLEIDPKDTDAHGWLMEFYWEKKQYDDVIKYATMAIKYWPNDDEDSKMQRADFEHNKAMALRKLEEMKKEKTEEL